ncbi:putative small heat shock protein HSP20 [Rosa chinensis]|uniref:Putative small heat shock protein HSP20 n=1 Tax=Rosa chinensis TaxID=74649 RepID=A0A2P6PRG2_ROSCH|nr:putative small heat shock protein HSP20 [Rosa chinensis]
MSLIPNFRRNIIFSLDLLDPFKDFQFSSSSLSTFEKNQLSCHQDRLEGDPRRQKPMCSRLIFRGPRKEEVKVEIEDDRVLQISRERKIEEDKNSKWHRIERSSGKFSRRFECES